MAGFAEEKVNFSSHHLGTVTSTAAGGGLTDTTDVIAGKLVTVTSRNTAAEATETAWTTVCEAMTATNADRQISPCDLAVRHFEVRLTGWSVRQSRTQGSGEKVLSYSTHHCNETNSPKLKRNSTTSLSSH